MPFRSKKTLSYLPFSAELSNFYKNIVSAKKSASRFIFFNAFHDSLTGLANRLLLFDRMENAIKKSKRTGKKVVVLFLDLDGFISVNDNLGHLAGDRLLQQVAQRIKSSIREVDTASRLGGDEFIVMLDGIKEVNGAVKVAKKILKVVSVPYFIESHKYEITASLGLAVYPEHGLDTESLIKNSDSAMHEVKKEGGNNYAVFVPFRHYWP